MNRKSLLSPFVLSAILTVALFLSGCQSSPDASSRSAPMVASAPAVPSAEMDNATGSAPGMAG
jgi:PBP1b-binding outer membrane lipoprotein LpoB